MDEFSSLREFTPHSLLPLFLPGAVVCLVATVARFITFALILKPFSEVACPGAKEAKQQRKFREAAWRASLYTVACGWAVKVVLLGDMPWVHESELFWKVASQTSL